MRKDTIFSYYIAVPQLYCDVASKINENHLLVCLHVEILWCREWKHKRPYRLHEFFCFNLTYLYKFVIFSIVILFCILFVFPWYWFLRDYSAGIFLWQKSYSVPLLSFLTSTALPALFFTKNRKKLTMNHLNCIISDHEDDNSSVECLSKWLATCSNLHCLEFSLRKAI